MSWKLVLVGLRLSGLLSLHKLGSADAASLRKLLEVGLRLSGLLSLQRLGSVCYKSQEAATGRAEACWAAIGTLTAEAANWLLLSNLQVQLAWLSLPLLAELLILLLIHGCTSSRRRC